MIGHSCMAYCNGGALSARSVGGVVVVYWLIGTTHIVAVVVVGVVVRSGGHPTIAVYFVVIGANEVSRTMWASVGVVGRNHPAEGWGRMSVVEPQIGGGTIHTGRCVVEEPYGAEVDGHHDLFSCIGIVAVYPYFEELRVYSFCPCFIEQYVGLDFIFIAGIDHQLVLRVQVVDCAQCL